MADEIVLALNQSADPGKCGSCRFFKRQGASEWEKSGSCKFRLPPTRIYVKQVWDGDSTPLDTVNDTDGCDFWISTGKTYVVSQRVSP
jgi:hypothetical protein